jgi:hypothetical protein
VVRKTTKPPLSAKEIIKKGDDEGKRDYTKSGGVDEGALQAIRGVACASVPKEEVGYLRCF